MKSTMTAKRWAAACSITLAAVAGAMPTKQELAQAQPLVAALTADDVRALNAKTKTLVEVAAAELALADKADTEAGKYLLMQSAFRLYVRGEDYDSAANVLQRMSGEISDLPPEVVVDLVSGEMRRVAAEKAPRVQAIFRAAKRMVRCRKQLPSLERAVAAKPNDTLPNRQLAECLACLGDWPKALPVFAKLGAVAAKYELDPTSVKDFDAAMAADFWWNYKASDAEPFKEHAASLYRAAIDGDKISGLKREIAAKRLAEFEASGAAIMAAAMGGRTSAPISGPWAIPANFKAPLVRTFKLADGVTMDFCACPAGSFVMGMDERGKGDSASSQRKNGYDRYLKHKVNITRPFWIGKFRVTRAQWGVFRSKEANDMDDLQKALGGLKIPMNRITWNDSVAYCAYLTEKYGRDLPRGYVFRLPTEAEWEYALRANTKDPDDPYGKAHGTDADRDSICENMDDSLIAEMKKKGLEFNAKNQFKAIHGRYNGMHCYMPPEGKKRPNAWGIYGMVGSGWQWMLDTLPDRGNEPVFNYAEEETDPVRINEDGTPYAICRGNYRGGSPLPKEWRGSWGKTDRLDDSRFFRIVIGPDLVAEKKAEKNGARAANPAPVPVPPTAHETQSATPSAAATKPPPAKIKTHTIKLNTNVSMEFVECPAGTFTMGYEKGEYSPNREHKVTITRPFWIARTKLTLEQYKAYDKKFKPCREDLVFDGDKSPFCAAYLPWPRRSNLRRQADAYCEYLTKKFRHAIPQGYVFRLPTDAEWEYAYTAGETNPNDFYGMSGNATKKLPPEEIEKYMITDKYIREYAAKVGKNYGKGYDATGVAVGQCKPNRWGLYDMAGNTCEMVLDTLDAKLLDTKSWYAGFGPKQTALVYKDEEVDPLRYIPMGSKDDGYGSLLKSVEMASRGGDGGKWHRAGIQNSFRIVVGPDLLKERGIKLPKRGK